MEEMTSFRIVEGSVQYGKRSHRAPFKVNCMTICPANDLIAIGSKNGDIVVKRSSWKQIWKLNLSNMGSLGRQLTKLASIESLAFSPDGEILSVGTNIGLLHIIDVETGLYKHTSKVGKGESQPSIDRLRWSSHSTQNEMLLSNDHMFEKAIMQQGDESRRKAGCEPLKPESTLFDKCMHLISQKPDVAQEDIAFVFQMLEEDSSIIKADDGVEETMENAFITSKKYRNSLQNTVLIAIRDDMIISIVLAGVMPIMEIDINEACSKMNLGLVMIYDAFYSRASGGVSIIATTHGLRPFFGESGKFGAYKSSSEERSNNTNVLNFKLEITDRMWDLALRYIRLIYGYTLMSISFDTLRKSWDSQMEILVNRFDTGTTNVKIGDLFIDMVLSGSTDSIGEAFLERGMGVDGLNGIREFCEKTLTDIGRIVRGQFTNAIRNISFQVTEFNSCMRSILREAHYHTQKDYFLQTAFNNAASHNFVQNQPVDNHYMQILERDAARMEYKTKQLVIECSIMLQELNHLWKWMSMMKPFAKNLKTNMLVQSKRMDIKQLMRFVIDTFVTDQTTKKNYESVMFNLKQLLYEIKLEEDRTGFDELKYVEDAKVAAEQMHKEFLKELRSLRPEVMEYSGNRLSDTFSKSDQKADGALSQSERTFDLDRVGSFLRMELSSRAKEKLPFCNDMLFGICDGRLASARNLDNEARNLGLERIVCDFANAILASYLALGENPTRSNGNCTLQWGFEIESSPAHRGFENVFIANAIKEVPTDNELLRGLHICCTTKTKLKTMVVLPPTTEYLRRQGSREGELVDFRRFYEIEKGDAIVKTQSKCGDDAMEVDENAEQQIRIDIDDMNMRKYNRLIEFDTIYPALNGDIILMGKFNSTVDPNSGVMRRMIYVKAKQENAPEKWIVQNDINGSIEVIERAAICADVSRGIYLFDDSTRVAVFALNEDSEKNTSIEKSETTQKTVRKGPTYREFQDRRDRIRKILPFSFGRPPTAQKIDLLAEEMIDDPSAELEIEDIY